MRKLIIIMSSLTLVIILLTSIGIPVMAAKPEEKNGNKPIAWVNFTGAGCGGGMNPGHSLMDTYPLPQGQFSVKLLSDLSVKGHLRLRFLGFEKDNPIREMIWEPVGACFDEDNGALIADILAKGTDLLYWSLHIEDNGEPGGGTDAFAIYLHWPGLLNYPPIVEPDYPVDPSTAYVYDETFNPLTSPIGWYEVIPYQTIAPDNIQVHITDAYWDLMD